MTSGFRFLKGHGTSNDFVVLPYGEVPDLPEAEMSELVRALCARRSGIGADGVLRADKRASGDGVRWFMDYRNSDGSIAEMCGNGIRVFARYLIEHEGETAPLDIDTRAGLKRVTAIGDLLTADMGGPELVGETKVSANGHTWPALHVSMGNPHAVAFVDSLDDAGTLLDEPEFDASVYPDGVNVEFVVRRGDRHVAMRVHERGSGETQSCGTGACAVMVASALADGFRDAADAAPQPASSIDYTVDVPGGSLQVEWTADNRILLTGPAVLVAEGIWVA